MLIGPRFLLLLPLAALLGCGSSPSSPTSTNNTITPTPYNFNGTWDANGSASLSQPQSAPFIDLSGPLQVSSSGAVTGTLTASTPYTSNNPNLCSANNSPLTVTGTLDADNDLTLTFPIAGGTGTLIATLANGPIAYGYGSWQVVGGTCPMSVTYIPINGTPTTPTVSPSPLPITANLSGNWEINVTYVPRSIQPVRGFTGLLQFSNGSVTGTLNLFIGGGSYGGGCQHDIGNTVTVTGTLDANNHLTMTFPVTDASTTGTGTITATLGPNLQTLADGSLQIVSGGPCAMPTTPLTIGQYAPVTGTYTGIFNFAGYAGSGNVPTPGSNISVTAVLTQSTTANANGTFPINGTVTVTGACTDSVTFAAGSVSGDSFFYASDTGDVLTGPYFTGISNPTASTILWAAFSDASTNSTCHAGITGYTGILTRQ